MFIKNPKGGWQENQHMENIHYYAVKKNNEIYLIYTAMPHRAK